MKIFSRLAAVSLIAAAAFLHAPGMPNSAAAAQATVTASPSPDMFGTQAYYRYHGHRYVYRWHGKYYNHRRGPPNHWTYY